MAASTDSDSSSEEDLAKFKEAAVDSSHFVAKLPNGKENGDCQIQKSDIPSRRPDKQENDDVDDNILQTTPGFRKHVAKKLTNALDRELDTSGSCFCPKPSTDTKTLSYGVKLLSSSKQLLDTTPPPLRQGKAPRKKRPPSSSSDSSAEDEKLAEASVSYNFIVTQSQKPVFNQKPAEVLVTEKQKPADMSVAATGDRTLAGSEADVKGMVESVEPAKRGEKQTDDSDQTDKQKKKKKKKKRHKSGDEIKEDL